MSDPTLNASKLSEISNKVTKIKTDICSKLSFKNINNFPKITPQTIADCGPLKKSLLAEHLLNIISMIEPLSQCSIKLQHSENLDINKIEHAVSKCITKELNDIHNSNEFNIKSVRELIENNIKGIQSVNMDDISSKLSKLQSNIDNLTTSLATPPPPQNAYITPPNTEDVVDSSSNTKSVIDEVQNPTKCIDNYKTEFISSERLQNLLGFLNNCEAFSNNVENGHSVAHFGYPYKYT